MQEVRQTGDRPQAPPPAGDAGVSSGVPSSPAGEALTLACANLAQAGRIARGQPEWNRPHWTIVRRVVEMGVDVFWSALSSAALSVS